MTRAELASTESGCHLHLGDAGAAERVAEFALSAIDPSFVRNLAMVSLKLSAARLQLARPDVAGAATAIGDAAKLAAHNRSTRVAGELRRGWQKFEPWHAVPEVKDARDRIFAYGLA